MPTDRPVGVCSKSILDICGRITPEVNPIHRKKWDVYATKPPSNEISTVVGTRWETHDCWRDMMKMHLLARATSAKASHATAAQESVQDIGRNTRMSLRMAYRRVLWITGKPRS